HCASESSRSKDPASAAPAQALANSSGRVPGTNSLLRITSPAIASSVRNPHRDQRRRFDVQKIILLVFALAATGPLLQACRPRSGPACRPECPCHRLPPPRPSQAAPPL